MEFDLGPDRTVLRDSAREFLARECTLEFARRHDEAETFPHQLYCSISALGWLGLPFDAACGGHTGDEVDEAVIVEQLGYAMMPLAACYLVTVLTCGKTIRDIGSDGQRRTWLPRIASGDAYISYGLTEPSAGSDAARVATRAQRTSAG